MVEIQNRGKKMKKVMVLDQIRKIAGDENVSVFGVASASAMAGEKLGHRSENLLLGAQSL